MTSKLSIVAKRQTETGSLRKEIDEVIAARRDQLTTTLRKWLIYSAEMGARRVCLDECPGIHARDVEFVVDWLRQEGFTVHAPKLMGRCFVDIHG